MATLQRIVPKPHPLNSKTKTSSVKGETEYYCQACDRYYASFKSYGNHVRSYHKEKEKSKCMYCGNSFTRHDNLQQHIKLFHSELDKQHVCANCGEVFVNRGTYSRHTKKCALTRVGYLELEENNITTGIVNGTRTFQDGSNVIAPMKKKQRLEESSGVWNKTCTKQSSCNCEECWRVYRKERDSLFGEMNKGEEVEPTLHSKENNKNNENKGVQHNTITSRGTNPTKMNSRTWVPDTIPLSASNSVDGNQNLVLDENCNINPCSGVNGDQVLDCIHCNITFLNKNDYDDHKPFCIGAS